MNFLKKFKSLFSILLIILLVSCGKETALEAPVEKSLVTASNKEVSMDGVWLTACETIDNNFLDESFIFDEKKITIFIKTYAENTCETLLSSERIEINYEVIESFEAVFNSDNVLANKISGTQLIRSTGQTLEFKQSLFINDEGTDLILYHGRFADDGGVLTDDGYPRELIPIAFTKQQ